MRSSTRFYTVLVLFLAACSLALADPEAHTTLSLEVRTCGCPAQQDRH